MENGATKNFTVDEFKCPCCGVDGVTPAAKEAVQQVRDIYGPMRLNSAYRCAKHNADPKVGGHPNSEHVQGLAFDVAVSTAEQAYRLVECALSVGFKGIGVYPGRIHIDYRLGRKSLWWGKS